jgi:nicotinamide-nucleotide amidase
VHVLGVSEQTLQANGAVHEETARQMAMGTRKVAGATYGLSTTGIAGPTGGSAEKPVGTVCIGIAAADEAWGRRLLYTFDDRDLNKTMFAHVALDLLRKKILADG